MMEDEKKLIYDKWQRYFKFVFGNRIRILLKDRIFVTDVFVYLARKEEIEPKDRNPLTFDFH